VNRRSIDSDYMRKKRISRRPLNNGRRVKRKTIVTTDKNIWTTVAVLTLIWFAITAYSIWMAFK